ncbi:MAG: hypothetical protein AAGB31_05340 [Bdellovibrio sp.]
MRYCALFILSFIGSWSLLTQANNSACFTQAQSSFFTLLLRQEQSPRDMALSMQKMCTELHKSEPHKAETLGQKADGLGRKAYMGLISGYAASAFSNLNENEEQRAYRQELYNIKKIINPMTRIQKVYELVVRNQGLYDYESRGLSTLLSGNIVFAKTPENLLNNAKSRGTAGICEDFAALLQWSLLQVARHSDSSTMALGPHDFSSEIAFGSLPEKHAWVRVHLPHHDEQGRLLGFSDFDLDTTFYPHFSPLYPRLTGLSEAERMQLFLDCTQIQTCLMESAD